MGRCSSPRLRLAWLTHALGWRSSHLRRRSDSVEAVCVLVLLLAAVVAVPLAVGAGSAVFQEQARRVGAEHVTRHRVEATVLAEPGARPDPVGHRAQPVGALRTVPVRWSGPDGAPRTADLPVGRSWSAGDIIPLWLDAAGQPAPAPITTSQAAGSAVVAAVSILLLAESGCVLLVVGVHAFTVRRAQCRWEREWAVVEPLWRHPRP